jgi:hypothetical protein
MMQAEKQAYEEEYPCLPPMAWAFLTVAILPQLLLLAGQELLASVLACGCFPVTMGPFAVLHATLLVDHLDLVSHMAWMSALVFSMTWFAILSWLWRKNRTVALATCSLCCVIGAELIWVGVLP